MDRNRRVENEGGKRSNRSSGDRQGAEQVVWDERGRTHEGLAALFTQQDLEVAQHQIEQRRLQWEQKVEEIFAPRKREVEELLSTAIVAQQNLIDRQKQDLATMPSQNEIQRFEKASQNTIYKRSINTMNELKKMEKKYIEGTKRNFNNDMNQDNKWYEFLDKLEYPVMQNDSDFTEHDRILLRSKIMELQKIQMKYEHDTIISEIKLGIKLYELYNDFHIFGSDTNLRNYHRQHNIPEFLEALDHDKNNYKTEWDFIANSEFKEALDHAKKYSKSLPGQQAIPDYLFRNPMVPLENFGSGSESGSDEE